MKKTLSNIKAAMLIILLSASLFACKKDNNTDKPDPIDTDLQPFNIVMASGSGSNSTTLLQATTDATKGEMSFHKKGFAINTSRAPHLGFSSDSKHIYVLYYRESKLEHYMYDLESEGQYKQIGTPLMLADRYGPGLRYKQINDKLGSLHEAIGRYENVDKANPDKLEGVTIFNVAHVKLPDFKINMDTWQLNLPVEMPEQISGKQGYVITRADSPVIDGDYIYYGINIGKFDPAKPDKRAGRTAYTGTLVLKYPSLTQPKVILHPEQLGATNGYRTPTMYKADDGYIYQLADNGKVTNIVRLKGGAYDTGFRFNLTEKLGKSGTCSFGWFYAGNGIGYIPFEDQDLPKAQIGVDPQGNPTYDSAYSIARIDLKSGNAIELEVPEKLWLRQYQSVTIRDGKIYFALASFGKPGNIHIWDIKSTNPKPQLGMEISPSGADQYYIGIF